MKRGDMKRCVLAALALLVVSAPARAHHSFGDIYLESDSVEIEGDIVEFQYKNPHSWIFVAGHDAFGREKIYGAEWVSTSQLERESITKTTLKVGDTVRIWGSPARNPNDSRMHLKRIRRSDGWEWRGRGNQRR